MFHLSDWYAVLPSCRERSWKSIAPQHSMHWKDHTSTIHLIYRSILSCFSYPTPSARHTEDFSENDTLQQTATGKQNFTSFHISEMQVASHLVWTPPWQIPTFSCMKIVFNLAHQSTKHTLMSLGLEHKDRQTEQNKVCCWIYWSLQNLLKQCWNLSVEMMNGNNQSMLMVASSSSTITFICKSFYILHTKFTYSKSVTFFQKVTSWHKSLSE